MNIFKKFYLRWKINRDEQFLISEGLRKAKRNELEVKSENSRVYISGEKKGEIRLPSYEDGDDVRELIALVADDYPDITKRYRDNKKILTG